MVTVSFVETSLQILQQIFAENIIIQVLFTPEINLTRPYGVNISLETLYIFGRLNICVH